ncbi:hypothetical protein MIND_01179800 [Mycena indigotica]|uniref:Uncharacterized protein n=1 Tax=Mycena indigotica TaxID=2126181 RepID=A0A8H6VYH3_9AGAR|nr:uncharacterized protein MIND_01179800 [Mycena indigotica]KAF7292809.1 hypothetical protein MIND_01179800 [Mycena indigotica]
MRFTVLPLLLAAIGYAYGSKKVVTLRAKPGAALVAATDIPPIVINIPSDVEEFTFWDEYLNACESWQPAIDQGLIFDFGSVGITQPRNDSRAEVQCQFDGAEGSLFTFALDVALSLGATPV